MNRSRASRIVTLALCAGLLLLGISNRDVLSDWFTGRPTSASIPNRAPTAYPRAAVDAIHAAMSDYERIRASLARDDVGGVVLPAHAMADALTRAAAAVDDDHKAQLARVAAATDDLSRERDLKAARRAFARMNAELLPLIAFDRRLARDERVFECPMFEHARWFQSGPAIENPYMGRAMLSCGTSGAWHDEFAPAGGAAIDYYTCSMHPSVQQPGPGKCPLCGMDLVPVTAQQQRDGVVIIDEGRRQLIGVRTAAVVEAPLYREVQVVGKVAYDEAGLTDVNLKVSGWITKLLVNQTGQRVSRGQPLFVLYSPDLYAAQQDLLLAGRSSRDAESKRAEHLTNAARKRLSLLGLSDSQIDKIVTGGEALESITIMSPASGYVIEKDVVEGASVQAGMRLLRIAALDKVWVEGDLYEDQLGLVHVGQAAKITLDYVPGRTYEAAVSFVYPYIDPAARTGRVRVELVNDDLELRPGMYARMVLSSDLGARVQVPVSAIVYTGPRRLVFVDLGEGRFKPQEVQVGSEARGMFEVLQGLRPGDVVATSGLFLISAEARISTAATYWDTEAADSRSGSDP
jgi:Cu(I)/Ag(I) efflux system membrane fusion protein